MSQNCLASLSFPMNLPKRGNEWGQAVRRNNLEHTGGSECYVERHHRRAFTKAIKEITSLFSEGYFMGREECLGKNSIVGKLPSCSSRFAYSFCSPSALNFPTFTPDPPSFSASSTYDSSIPYFITIIFIIFQGLEYCLKTKWTKFRQMLLFKD